MRQLFRNNGLSLVLLGLFLLFFFGQVYCGWLEYIDEQVEHGESEVTLSEYLTTGDFVEATAEKWESEFLQMGLRIAHGAAIPTGIFRVQKTEWRGGRGSRSAAFSNQP